MKNNYQFKIKVFCLLITLMVSFNFLLFTTNNKVFAEEEIVPTNLRWDSTVARWDAPSGYTKSYNVTLIGSSTTSNPSMMTSEIVTVETTDTMYNFSSYINDCMNYCFRVQAKQSDDIYKYDTRSLTYAATGELGTFSYINWDPSNSDTLKWLKPYSSKVVEGYYIIVKKDGAQVGKADYIESKDSIIRYSIYDYLNVYGIGVYSADIFATTSKGAPNYCAKGTSPDNNITGFIQDITLVDGVLSWKHYSAETTKYEILIGSGGGFQKISNLDYDSDTNRYSYSLKNECLIKNEATGSKKWEISAYEGNTQTSIVSIGYYDYVDIKTPLDQATNLKWDGATISWDPVPNAARYLYRINEGVSTLTDQTSVKLSVFETGIEYYFYVTAVPEDDDLIHTKSVAKSPAKTFTSVVTLNSSNVAIGDLIDNKDAKLAEKVMLDINVDIPGAYLYEVNISTSGGNRYNLPINLLNICKGLSITSGTYDVEIVVRDIGLVPLTNTYTITGWSLDTSKYGNDLTGDLKITGTPRVGETLTASISSSNNTGTLSYNWIRYYADKYEPDEINPQILKDGKVYFGNTYTLTNEDVGYRLCCFASSTVESGSIQSNLSSAVTGLEIISVGGVSLVKGELTEGSFPIGHVGKTYGPVTLAAAGGSGNYTWKVLMGKLTEGLTLNSTTGVVSGIPTTTCTGYLTFEVTDNITHSSATTNLNFTVADDDWAPSITTDIAKNGVINKLYQQEFKCNCGVADSITWALVKGSLPSGLMLGKSGSYMGYITGTPSVVGTYTFTLKAENAYGSDTKEYTIVIEDLLTLDFKTGNYYLGDTVQINASIGNNNVNWSVDGYSSKTTIDNNGLLTIGEDEDYPSSLLITAKSKTNSYNYNYICVAYTPQKSYSITIIDGTAYDSYNLEKTKGASGDAVKIEASTLTGKVFRCWSVEEGSTEVTFNNSNSSLTTFTMPEGKVIIKANYDIVITAVSATIDTPINGNKVNKTVQTDSPNYTASIIALYEGAGFMSVDDAIYQTGKNYVFYVSFKASPGYTLAEKDTLQVKINGKLLDYASEYHFMYEWMRTLTAITNEVPHYEIKVNNGLITKINESTEVASNAKENDVITISANEISGKVFEKWESKDVTFIDSNASTTTFIMPAKAVTISAIYSNIKYKISFDANGGTGTVEEVTKEYNETYILPECSIKAPTGHEFKCWMIDNVEKEVGKEITITSDVTIKAIWKNLVFTISFDTNKGTGDIDSIQKEYGENYTLPICTLKAPTSNETFKGWEVDGKEYKENDSITITKDSTIKALWKYIVYSISFDANAGSGSMNQVEKNSGATYTLPECTYGAPTGRKFKCWLLDDKELKVGEVITINSNITLKAIWEFIAYNISFDANGATGQMDDFTKNIGETFTLPECTFTALNGKKFKCWRVDGKEFNVGDVITINSNVVIIAIWEDITDQNIPYKPTEDYINKYDTKDTLALTFEKIEKYGVDLTDVLEVVKASDKAFELIVDNISITFDNDAVNSLNNSVILKIKKLTDLSKLKVKGLAAYEVSMEGSTINKGNLTIELPFTESIPEGKRVKVYCNETCEDLNASLENNRLIFETKKLSTYVVSLVDETNEPDPEPTHEPIPSPEKSKAGVVVGIIVGIIVILAASYFVLGFVFYKKGKLTGKVFETIFKWIK